MVRMATERISWKGLIRREVGSLSSTFFSSISPSVWVLRSSAQMYGADGGQAVVPAPCSQPPTMVCKENRKVRKWLGRDGGAVPTGSSSLSAIPSSAIGHAREAAASLGWCQ